MMQVIQTYSERMSYRPWKNVLIYDRAQCGTPNDIMSLSRDQALMSVQVEAGKSIDYNLCNDSKVSDVKNEDRVMTIFTKYL